ncbi:hypothetical protein VNO78_02518 [Psophocarpus tetragonolobus]|uniref:Uncharacterized protein n=1 Tax=Psophocarpus tetragonolobus TaxID=3891 RepID=A0AAN9SZ13_PSOTE
MKKRRKRNNVKWELYCSIAWHVCVCVVATWDGTVNKKEEKGEGSECCGRATGGDVEEWGALMGMASRF